MKKANENLKDGKENLFQTNEYQQDTNKKFMIFCCLTVVIVSIVVLIVYSSSGRAWTDDYFSFLLICPYSKFAI